MSDFLQVTLSGLATGSLYALMLVGILLVYQVSKNLNFAYGQVGMLGAYVGYFLTVSLGMPSWVGLLIGISAAGLLAALMDLFIIRRIPERHGYDLVVTLGALLFFTAIAELIFGTAANNFVTLLGNYAGSVGGVYVNANDLLSIVLGAGAMATGYYVIKRTDIGVSLRAAAENAPVAMSVGINVLGLRTVVWAASGFFVAVAAMMFAARLSINPFYMTPILINVFIAGMIGGLDRYWPPIIAALGISVYESWVQYWFGGAAATPGLFILIIIALSLAPKRFLEERHEGRA